MLTNRKKVVLLAAGLGLVFPLVAAQGTHAFAEGTDPVVVAQPADVRDPGVQEQLDRADALMKRAEAELKNDADPSIFNQYQATHDRLIQGIKDNRDTNAEQAKRSVDSLENTFLPRMKKNALAAAKKIASDQLEVLKQQASPEVIDQLDAVLAEVNNQIEAKGTYTEQRTAAQEQLRTLSNAWVEQEKEAAKRLIEDAYQAKIAGNNPQETHYSEQELQELERIKNEAIAEIDQIEATQSLLNNTGDAFDNEKIQALKTQITQLREKTQDLDRVQKTEPAMPDESAAIAAEKQRAAELLQRAEAELKADGDETHYEQYKAAHDEKVAALDKPGLTAAEAKQIVDALENETLPAAKNTALDAAKKLVNDEIDKLKGLASEEAAERLEVLRPQAIQHIENEQTYAKQREHAKRQVPLFANEFAGYEKEAVEAAISDAHAKLLENNDPNAAHYSEKELAKLNEIKDQALKALAAIDENQNLLNDTGDAVDDTKLTQLLDSIKAVRDKINDMNAVPKTAQPDTGTEDPDPAQPADTVEAQKERAAALLARAEAELKADEDSSYFEEFKNAYDTAMKGINENPNVTAENAKKLVDALEAKFNKTKESALQSARELPLAAVDALKDQSLSPDETAEAFENLKNEIKAATEDKATYAEQLAAAKEQIIKLPNKWLSLEKQAAADRINDAYQKLRDAEDLTQDHYTDEERAQLDSIKDAALAALNNLDTDQPLVSADGETVDDDAVAEILKGIQEQLNKIDEMAAVTKSAPGILLPSETVSSETGNTSAPGASENPEKKPAQTKKKALPRTADAGVQAGVLGLLSGGLALIAAAAGLRRKDQ